MTRYAIHYGGILGASAFAVFLILYLSGVNPLGNASWVGAWIPIVVIARSVKMYREHECEGFITYGNAFRTGVTTAIMGGILSALLIFIFCTVIDSSVVDRFRDDSLAQLELMETQFKGLLNEATYDKLVEDYQSLDIKTIALSEFMSKSFSGFILSLIIAAVYKKNHTHYPSE
ncbi:MAG: DUF4199 domain-containing protein [Bacteroidetes bacterium]|jgi:hypothetical protein|nr:DUF4199 domain-containing protein [Bacteroidota bacterium]